MKNKYVFVVVLLAVILVIGVGLSLLFVRRQEPDNDKTDVTVVTSFYPMYIAAENVIGDCNGVQLENLTEQQSGCLHNYQLTTEDMKLLSTADVFIINGGGIESFLEEVAQQYPDLIVIDTCEGIDLLDDNAHVWMNMEDYTQQVQNICEGLCAVDTNPKRDETYQQNAKDYIGKIGELKAECADLAAKLAGQPVILFHEAYEYLAGELDLSVVGLMDLDEERQVSAGEVAEILSVIEKDHVPVIFAEELYAKDMGERMEQESEARVVYLDPLTRGDYNPDSYLLGMQNNLDLIRAAYEK